MPERDGRTQVNLTSRRVDPDAGPPPGGPWPWLTLHETRSNDGELRLALEGELDIATSGAVAERLSELCLAGTPTTLDLARITFIDGRGLRVILDALDAADRTGAILEILPELSVPVRRLVRLIRTSELADRLPGIQRLGGSAG